MQQLGDHSERKDLKQMKRKMARKYARDYEPARALVQMEKDEVPIDLRPPVYLLQNYRPSRAQQTEKQVADSIASLEAFVARPPSQLGIATSRVLT